jgi:hypothetical protein
MKRKDMDSVKIRVPFSDYINLLKPDVPRQLVSEQSLSNIGKVTSLIPGCLAFSTFGFECPLGVDEAEADFLFSLRKNNGGPAILSGQYPQHDFDPSLFDIPQWSQVRRFGKLWNSPPSPIFDGIDDVWMEFDVASARAPQNIKAPSIFFAPCRSASATRVWKLENALEQLGTIFTHLKGRHPPDACIRNWKCCFESLRNPTAVFQVGVMIARLDSNTLRMCILTDNIESLKSLLRNFDWPGDFSGLDPILKTIQPFFDHLRLHIDLGEEMSGKIGIECQFPERKSPQKEPLWFPFLDFLVGEGLCRTAKRDALIQYPGYRETGTDICPPPLQRIANRLFPLYRSFFVRSIYHVKLVMEPSGIWSAKAYLGVNHLWKGLYVDNEPGAGPWGIIG